MRGWIKHIPVVAGVQRLFVKHFLSGAPFVHTINAGPAAGLRFEISLPKDKAIWTGMVEPEFSAALRDRTRPGDVCYDIGGYRGYMSGVMALAGAQPVITFEPLTENIAAIRKLMELNRHLPIQIQEIAVGKCDGEVQFSMMADPSMGKLTTSPFQNGAEVLKSVTIRMRRLDTLVFEKGLPRPDVIKIDVEGAEADVLRGAEQALSQHRATIFIETHSASLRQECSQLLGNLGYRVRQLDSERLKSVETSHLVAELQ
jgi:FkbM family methyltransferase